MPDIVLSTLNAKYIHAAFGLRYLLANLGPLRERAVIAEFDINQRPLDIAEALLALNPKILGLGVYIWNVTPTTELVAVLKRLRPDLIIILGGPEVSYETESQRIVELADHVITGEADLKFAEVCEVLLEGRAGSPLPAASTERQLLRESTARSGVTRSTNDGRRTPSLSPPDGERIPRAKGRALHPGTTDRPLSLPSPPLRAGERGGVRTGEGRLPKIIPASLPEFSQLALPYEFYNEQDIAHRIIYVEASRGCPFTCEFCLSSLDIPVRGAPLPTFLDAMQKLLDRGVRQFKFVDRTFNLNLNSSRAILEFFLARHQPGNFYHFEMIPDRLPEGLRELIQRFPPGTLQFEVGVQTLNPAIEQNISRRQDHGRLVENFRFLREQTHVHIHADLIVGLPGETVESFAAGFDQLVALRPQEIQVGILKRLRGTPIVRHDAEWQMTYSPHPPYEILADKLIDFATMQRLRRFARYWDIVANSGNFIATTPLLWHGTTPFAGFLRWNDWLYAQIGRTDGVALVRLMELVFRYLTTELRLAPETVASPLWRDYQRGGRKDKPAFLQKFLADEDQSHREAGSSTGLKRQARHHPIPITTTSLE